MSASGRAVPGHGPVAVKVGGSLFDLPELPRRLSALLDSLEGSQVVLLAGGGAAADLARGWDRAFHLGEERAHKLALAAMAFNGRLLLEIVPESHMVGDRAGLDRAWAQASIPVIDPGAFIEKEEGLPAVRGLDLPHLWAATSDSVAAWIAVRLGAGELVLLKSAAPPRGSLLELAALGYVDEHFARIAAGIKRISVVNLREEGAGRRAVRR